MMKKNLLLLFMMLLAFTACEGPAGPPGQNGTGMTWFVKTYTIRENDWKLYSDPDGRNSFYKCEVRVNDLSNDIYLDGNVFAYWIQNPGRNDEVQTPLPYTIPLENTYDERWSEIINFDFMPGSITFYVTYSDFATSVAPGEAQFRVVMNY
ncbi:hypothetical protein [Parabacteroides bouchesdurhonensis]|uniref:hypothetical protein n=1 Tax=Parabacteroides bouchesdurhonensis TaxID=1936995 RepID=UPI000C8560C3|nr:hypothetical protein [Parabacteroides bouchesdurhonensis]